MTVRRATKDDINDLLLMGEALRYESPTYRIKSFCHKKIESFLNEAMDNPNCLVLIAESGGESAGYFIGGANHDFASFDVTAFDLSFYVLPDKRKGGTAVKLMKAFEAWAKEIGARYIRVGISTGIHTEKTSQFYQLLGFKPDGICLEKEVH